jgi:hypothetical protein
MAFCGFGGVFLLAAMAGRPIKPAASAEAVNVRALRRVTEYAFRQISHMLSPMLLTATILVGTQCKVNLSRPPRRNFVDEMRVTHH